MLSFRPIDVGCPWDYEPTDTTRRMAVAGLFSDRAQKANLYDLPTPTQALRQNKRNAGGELVALMGAREQEQEKRDQGEGSGRKAKRPRT